MILSTAGRAEVREREVKSAMDQPASFTASDSGKAFAVADAALRGGHVLRHPLAVGVGVGFFEILLEKFENAVEAEAFFFFRFRFFREGVFRAGPTGGWIAVEDQVLDFLRELIERRIEIEAVGVGGKFERALQNCGRGAGAEAAIEKRAAEIVENFGGIEIVFRAEAVAGRASAVR